MTAVVSIEERRQMPAKVDEIATATEEAIVEGRRDRAAIRLLMVDLAEKVDELTTPVADLAAQLAVLEAWVAVIADAMRPRIPKPGTGAKP